MKYIGDIQEAFKEVYAKRKYFFFSGLFSLLVFSFNAAIRNYKLLFSEFSVSLLFNLILAVHNTMSSISLIFLILISLLSGIVFSLSIFLLRRQITYSAGIGLSGIITSILTPACSSCALGLAGILGIGWFLTLLPFKGLELGVLGIVLLGMSITYLSGKIVTKVCSVKR